MNITPLNIITRSLSRDAYTYIHVHVPQGAVPKDGPSAGIALATSILSALTKGAPSCRVAMTGEITIHGKVLPIGGLKEKLLAAQRENLDLVIIPEKNKPQFKELPVNLKKRLKVEFVKDYGDVFELIFEYGQNKPMVASVPREKSQDLAS